MKIFDRIILIILRISIAVSNTLKFIETIEHQVDENEKPDIVDWENWAI